MLAQLRRMEEQVILAQGGTFESAALPVDGWSAGETGQEAEQVTAAE